MNLTLKDRIILQSILPTQGNYVTLLSIREIRSMLDPSVEEREKYDVKVNGQMIAWNDAGNTDIFDIPLAKSHIAIIKGALQNMNQQNQLSDQMIDLYITFCLKDGEESKPDLTVIKPDDVN